MQILEIYTKSLIAFAGSIQNQLVSLSEHVSNKQAIIEMLRAKPHLQWFVPRSCVSWLLHGILIELNNLPVNDGLIFWHHRSSKLPISLYRMLWAFENKAERHE